MTAPDGDNRSFFAACGPGFEPLCAGELRALGARDIEERRGGVAFKGGEKKAMAACLWLRTAIRVQELLWEGPAGGPRELYAGVASIDWSELMTAQHTLAVDAAIRDSAMTHSGYVALTVKDAIVDQFREKSGDRPDVDTKNPDVPLKLVLRSDQALLYRDWAGASLHKRGYHALQVKSPLNECVAASLLLLSGWDKATPLADPMCGSGTFAIEAALMAADHAPGLRRDFAFMRWPGVNEGTWKGLMFEAERRAKKRLPFLFDAADRHPGALSIARQSAREAGVGEFIRFTQADCREWKPAVAPKFIVANPPYGERLGEGEDLADSWKALGNFLHRCEGAVAFVLSGNPELSKHLGLKAKQKWPVKNGPIECRWIKYEILAKGARAAREPKPADR